MTNYILDKEFKEAEKRLAIKEKIQDPATIDYLNIIGIKPGWHCLEIGSGRGSITSWLCQKAGPEGRVTAIDKDTRFLKTYSYQNLEIIEEDIAQYELGVEKYNLIHTRDVLVHIENREELIKRMTTGLKYDGWILLEEPDVITDTADPLSPGDMQDLYQKTTEVIYSFLQSRGLDPFFGRKIFGILNSLGFESLCAEGRVQMFQGEPNRIKSPHIMAFEQLKDSIVAEGLITPSEFTKFLELANNPSFAWREGLTMSVWGQRKQII